MPSTLTYPGVYIEEVSSGVRSISGVATSIAAFAGWAARGPTDEPQLVLSWSDFERSYGGLDRRALLGYAVQHFFANGGAQAYILRLAHSDAATATVDINSETAGTTLTFSASSPGKWANSYAVAVQRRSDDPTRFRITVLQVSADGIETPVESFENLSMKADDPRSISGVIESFSSFIRVSISGTAPEPPLDTGTPSPRLGSGTTGSDGTVLEPNDGDFETALTTAIPQLERVDLFNILCVPGETTDTEIQKLQKFCQDHRAFLIADTPADATFTSLTGGPSGAITGASAINAALYFPWVKAPDPLNENRLRAFPPSGFVAGLYARTDSSRGVWKAPAGTDASITGAAGLKVVLTDTENGILNIQAINCLRQFGLYGNVVWGARTLHGHNDRGSEWKYIPVRRTALMIEESLYRGTQWVVFEPNDEPLWAQIRLNIGAFMHSLFRQGAFQGRTPREAYFIKCDAETTTQDDINRGIVNIHVGFAPLKPAEFVVIKIQQIAGQIQT